MIGRCGGGEVIGLVEMHSQWIGEAKFEHLWQNLCRSALKKFVGCSRDSYLIGGNAFLIKQICVNRFSP